MKRIRHNYTVIELVVVLGIAAVLIGLALPGFDRMINGDKVTAAARRLSSALAHARAEAIVSGRKVALLLPMATGSDTFKNDYRNRSFCVVRLSRDNDSQIDVKALSEAKWTMLPRGTVIGNIDSSDATQFSATKTSASPLTTVSVNLSATKNPLKAAGSSTSYYAIRFLPDGTVDSTANMYLFVTEGISDNGSLKATNPGASAAQPNNTMCLMLNKYTGRAAYKDL